MPLAALFRSSFGRGCSSLSLRQSSLPLHIVTHAQRSFGSGMLQRGIRGSLQAHGWRLTSLASRSAIRAPGRSNGQMSQWNAAVGSGGSVNGVVRAIQRRGSTLKPNSQHKEDLHVLQAKIEAISTKYKQKPTWRQRVMTGGKPFSPDDRWNILGFAIVGTAFWVAIGSTSLISVGLFLANTLQFQELIATKISSYVSYSMGLDMTFQSALVPKWANRTIRIRNVRLCRPIANALEENAAEIDLTIDVVDIKISILQFLAGRGPITQLKIRGVRGSLDNHHTVWTEEMLAAYKKRDPQRGDFELEKLSVKDMQITVRLQNPPRPINIEIFNMKSRRFRQHWLLFDMLTCDFMVGSFDGCLFSIQRPKEGECPDFDLDHRHKLNHFKIAGLNADLITSSYVQGPLSWIDRGTFDISMFYKFPIEYYQVEQISSTLAGTPMVTRLRRDINQNIDFVMDYVLKNLSATVPFTAPEVSYVSNAMIQAIVAYFNTNFVEIPTRPKFVLTLDDFYGAWYPSDARILEKTSEAVYDEITDLIQAQRQSVRVRELLWIAFDGIVRGTRHLAIVSWFKIRERL